MGHFRLTPVHGLLHFVFLGMNSFAPRKVASLACLTVKAMSSWCAFVRALAAMPCTASGLGAFSAVRARFILVSAARRVATCARR
jgi:hypothetical protein